MTIEQNLKNLLGDYTFQICVAQQQIEDLTKERDDLKAQLEEKAKNVKS